jgi:hydroxymethylglutaryl-CoA lyase
MSRSIRLYEVSPRDGLQNEPEIVSTDAKVALIERIVAAGFTDVEVTSFVSPRFIPQLADAAEVIARLQPLVNRTTGVRFWALVPNPVGLDRAVETGIRNIATFMSASETHNQKNVNRTVKESLAGLKKVIGSAVSHEMRVRAYISTALGCPYEGDVAPAKVVELALALREAGAHEIALGDTTGMGEPAQLQDLIGALVAAGIPVSDIACHLHDTRGTALVNAYAAWKVGVTTFDGSIAGIGGCPYSTEDLLHLFMREGCDIAGGPGGRGGIDLEATCEAGAFMSEVLGRTLPGRYHQYWLGARAREARRKHAAGS